MLLFIVALILIFVNIAIIFYDFFGYKLKKFSYVIYYVNADKLDKFLDELIIALYEEGNFEVIEDYYIKKDSAKEFIKFSNGIMNIEIAIIEYNKKIKKAAKDCCIEECLKDEKVFQEIEGIRYF